VRAAVMESLALYVRLIGAGLRSQMQYRVSFVLETVAVFVGTFTDFLCILILFGRVDHIGGWTMPEVALLYGLVVLGFALAQFVGSGFEDFEDVVRRGTFDQVLIKPRGATFQIFATQLPLRRLGRFLQGGMVLTLALGWLGVRAWWGPERWLFLAWTLLGGMLFFLGLFFFRAAVCFWTVESIEATNLLLYGGQEMGSYPMHIFGEWLRGVFIYLIPLAFVNYFPALYLLGRPNPLGGPPHAALLAVPLCALTCAVGYGAWSLGVRHYQSTGS
jgi:ABC-2 type transport system permease protein